MPRFVSDLSSFVSDSAANGAVVFDNGASLPEGLEVTIICPPNVDTRANASTRRIQLPLVHCDQPGSVHLTNERIAEILDAEDVAS